MRRLAILRPEPGATQSLERARALGLDAVTVPLFEVERIAWQAPDPSQFDALLLTSANAVRHAGSAIARLRQLPVLSVGEATADAAREAGLPVATVGSSDVQALLDSIEPGERLLHLCGEHRRIPADSRHRITSIPVYRSVALAEVDGLAMLERAVAAVHSPRAARRLAELSDRAGLDRSSIRIAAISAAAAEAAGTGWECVESAREPNDRSLLALAARLCDKDGQE